MNERIKILRQTLELSQVDFARRIGIPGSTVSKYERGDVKPSSEILSKIGKEFSANLNWLLTGNGDILNGQSLADNKDTEFIYVPLMSEVKAAAGTGYLIEEELAERSLSFRKDWLMKQGIAMNMLSAIHVAGDSMTPTLINNDVLLVDRSQTNPRIDQIYVVWTEDGLVVKRSGGLNENILTLVSDNPAIRDRAVCMDEQNFVVGRVVWYGRKL